MKIWPAPRKANHEEDGNRLRLSNVVMSDADKCRSLPVMCPMNQIDTELDAG